MNRFASTLKKTTGKNFILFCLVLFYSLNSLAQPSISSFSPASGAVGSTVTISGTNFNATPASNIVFFGAVRANVTSATTTTLTVTVPASATYQPISVSTNGLTAYSSKPFVVTFNGAATQFTPKSFDYVAHVDSVDSNIETTKYTIGDLDNDGKIDVLTVDRLNNVMSIYRNTSTGGAITFAPKINFGTGNSPRSITVGDIDGDGKQDVMVTNFGPNTVSVYRNTTSGATISFAPKVDFVTAMQPAAISVADIDKDGKPDLVINTVNLGGYVSVLRNTGSTGIISFATKIDLQSSGGSIEEIRVADVDGDTKPDVLVPNDALNTITIFRNTSSVANIAFASAIQISSFSNPTDIELGDLNDDGKLDMVVGHYVNTRVLVLKNVSTAGNIVFQYMGSVGAGIAPSGLAVCDLDGDSKPDLVVTNGLESFSVYKNSTPSGSDISFNPGVITPAVYNSKVLSADFDGDGKADLAFNTGILRVTVWKNNTTGPQIFSFSPASAKQGDTVTILGSHFDNATSVSFGGVPASSFTLQDASTILAVVGAGATGDIKIITATDSSSIAGFLFEGPPVISSYTPATAAPYDTITIKGQNFNGATAVKIGGVIATFIIIDPFTIKAIVSTGASGDVLVTNPFGTAVKAGFVYIPRPFVSSFLPVEAITGATVTIKGFNFSGITSVSFGGVPATSFTMVDSVTITAVVGNGASGNVSVTNSYGTGSLAGFTYIPPPVVSSFIPANGGPGTVITISGLNFTQASAVKFGGINASSFKVISPTVIEAVVGSGSSGNISIASFAGTGTIAGFSFVPPPVINSFSPMSGPVGTIVTISGSNFSTIAANNIVYFGSEKAQVTSATANSLTVVTPVSANYQRITVTVNRNTVYSIEPFKVTFNGGNTVLTPTSFSSNIEFKGGSTDPISFSTADLDGDGKPEVIFPDLYSHAILVFPNTSTGGVVSFGPQMYFAAQWLTYFLTTGDFNGDGKIDVASTTGGPGISIFINTSTVGSISFAPRVDISSPTNILGIIAEEVDGDGRTDLVTWGGNFIITVFQNKSSNDGNIAFSKVLDVFNSYMNVESLPMRVIDLDADKKPDLIVADAAGTVAVYRNTSVGETISFASKVEFPSTEGNSWLALGDIDGDGKPDVVTNSGTSSAIVLRNLSTTGNISFAPKVEVGPGKTAYEIARDVNIGDMNGDGKPDIVIVPETPLVAPAPPRNILIYQNNSTAGSISFDSAVAYINSAGADHIYSAIDDVTNDGKPDVISGYHALLSVLANQAGGPGIISFTPTTGKTGTEVIITGFDFTGATGVSFGGVAASSFTINSDSSITAIVSSGASGIVSVTGPHGTAMKSGFVYIPAPVINSFTPTVAGSGATVIINGKYFTGASVVSFGGLAATSFTVTSDSTISAVIGTGASGAVSVTTPGGTGELGGFTFSTVTAIVDPVNVNSKELRATPNPSHDVIIIWHPVSAKKATIRFVDILGRTAKTLTPVRLSSKTETNVDNLMPGLYVVVWTDGQRTLSRTITVH